MCDHFLHERTKSVRSIMTIRLQALHFIFISAPTRMIVHEFVPHACGFFIITTSRSSKFSVIFFLFRSSFLPRFLHVFGRLLRFIGFRGFPAIWFRCFLRRLRNVCRRFLFRFSPVVKFLFPGVFVIGKILRRIISVRGGRDIAEDHLI